MEIITKRFEAGRDFNQLKGKVKEIGDVDQACKVICEDIKSDKLPVGKCSIKDMFEALTTSTFPKAVGTLINKSVIAGYETVPTIGQDLVTVVPSNKITETVVGFDEVDTPDIVLEGMPYGETGFGEKYVTMKNIKRGRIISITEETIKFDQTGQVIQRARMIGEKSALKKEQLIVEGVIDANSTVYKPSGIATAFYSTSASPANATATVLGESGLDAVQVLVAAMTDANSDPILINEANMLLLTGSTLRRQAWELMNSPMTPEGAEGARNYFKGLYSLRYSPFVTSTTNYFIGDFKKDFWWTEVYPLQLLERSMNDTDEGFKRDIIAQFKARFYGAIGAVDNKHSFKGAA